MLDIHSDKAGNNMHHHVKPGKSSLSCRAYQPKAKQEGIIEHDLSVPKNLVLVEKDFAERCLSASTTSNIDLPHISVQAAANIVSQNLLFDKEIEFPLNREVLHVPSNVKSRSESLEAACTTSNSPATPVLINSRGVVQSNQTQDLKQNTGDAIEYQNTACDTVCASTGISSLVSPNDERKTKGQKITRSRNQRNKSSDISQSTVILKRPEYQVLGFMEDYAEFGTDWTETLECQGRYTSSVLESTVDGSIIKGARRAYGPRKTVAELTSCIDSAIESGDSHQDPLKALDDWGLKSEQHKYKCSACEVTSQNRVDIKHHISDEGDTHSKAVVVVLLGKKAQGRHCSLCNVRLNRNEYFKHIREVHRQVFPLRCGYCVFQGQDHNQMRHHIQKKHGTSEYNVTDIRQAVGEQGISGKAPSSTEAEATDDNEHTEEDSSSSGTMNCPLCGRELKTLQNLRKHVMQHSRQKKQCNLCSFTTNFPTQIRSHYQRKHPTETPKWKKIVIESDGFDTLVEDATPYLKLVTAKYGVRKPKEEKWMRQYRCPHCDYTCNFNSSYNRHLRVHEGVKPFKCGYCNFHGREAYVVRRHCSKSHKGLETKVVYDKDFKAPYRYSKKIRAEKFDWDECNEASKNEMKSVINRVIAGTVTSNMKAKQCTESEAGVMKSKVNSLLSLSDDTTEKSLSNSNFSLSDKITLQDGVLSQVVIQMPVNDQKQNNVSGKQNNDPKKTKMQNFKPFMDDKPAASNLWTGGQEAGEQIINTFFENSLSDISTLMKTNEKPIDAQNEKTNSNTEECEAMPMLLIMKKPEIEDIQMSVDKSSKIITSQCKGISPTVRVKTFRSSLESSVKYTKENFNSDDETNKTSMQISELNFESESSSNCINSSIIVTPTSEHFDSLEDETVVIQLYASEFYASKEIFTHDASEELEDGCAKYQDSWYVTNLESSTPQKIPEGNVKSDDGIADRVRPPEDMFKENRVAASECHELMRGAKTPNSNQGKSRVRGEHLSRVPSQGLENTLHTHITFLTDSLAHRLSNRISATPGVMTRDLLDLDYTNNDYFSGEKVRMMMKKRKGGRVKCRECGVSTTFRAFYKHAKKHFNIKPFKCGYCSYRSIEKSKIRVHNAFCHSSKPCIILKLSPESASTDESTSQTVRCENIFNANNCKAEVMKSTSQVHESGMPDLLDTFKVIDGRICNKSSWTEKSKIKCASSPNNKAGVGSVNKCLSFQCPICNKILKNHTPSIRRHLYSHYGYKPYKCGYCAFTAIGQTEIRAHHVTHGSVSSPKIELSGVAMPIGLIQYIDEFLDKKRGNKRINKKREQQSQIQCNSPKNMDTDVMWDDLDPTCKEDLTSVYLNSEDKSQQNLASHQDELETLSTNHVPCSSH